MLVNILATLLILSLSALIYLKYKKVKEYCLNDFAASNSSEDRKHALKVIQRLVNLDILTSQLVDVLVVYRKK